ncbi:MAG: dihydropteroate synthase [Lachnospiraceae bacterium]|nr:dihydropteroate synthase [Lachnospiraceae bacterium]
MIIGNKEFHIGKKTYIMGILNITPDSFSDGGLYNKDAYLKRADIMLKEGCDIIDVGGESTRPGYEMISTDEEIERVAPVIECLLNHFDVPVSLDTYKYEVAKVGIEAGISLINDIRGLKYDSKMAKQIAEHNVACCLMHNRNISIGLNHDLIDDVKDELAESVNLAKLSGIGLDKIILDPGIGFGKSYEDNLLVLNNLAAFSELGFPLLLGASRKSVIGLTLDLPVDERIEGTIVTTVMAVMAGYTFVRVHDIQGNKRAVKMAEAIKDSAMERLG